MQRKEEAERVAKNAQQLASQIRDAHWVMKEDVGFV